VYDDPAADPKPHAPIGPRPVATKLLTRTSRPASATSGGGAPPASASERDPTRPTEPGVCPYLRGIDDEDRLLLPILAPDPANRCGAMGDAVPQSLRQQELVCLTSGHVNCPRYQRASMPIPVTAAIGAAARSTTRTLRVNAQRPVAVTPATAAALVIFLVAFAVSLGFMLANGGLALSEAATPPPSAAVLGEVETAPPGATPAATPPSARTPAATATPAMTAQPTPAATPVAATPVPTPRASADATARPTSGRYALLRPCPDQPDCWIYRVRSGDNLYSIARYFGVPLRTVQAWNPWTANGLKAGRDLRIPSPTR
jgi:LysM domain-containing protein